MSFLRLFVLVLITCPIGSAQGAAVQSEASYSVLYTGKLFGYFRYPNEQATSDVGCPDPASVPLSSPAQHFQDELLRARRPIDDSTSVLVSLGDNFAPELPARFMRDVSASGTEHAGELLPKDLFVPNRGGDRWTLSDAGSNMGWLHEISGKVPADNVGCFLRTLRFQAVVPGQEDFSFGPERLRSLARFLAEPPTSHDGAVAMLAGNLIVRSVQHTPAPKLPLAALPKHLQAALLDNPDIQFQLPVIVLPYLQNVTIQTHYVAPKVFDCPAAAGDPYGFALPSDAGSGCLPMAAMVEHPNRFQFSRPLRPSANYLPAFHTLDPDSNHALCVQYVAGNVPSTTCKVFHVDAPLLQYHPETSGTTPPAYLVLPPNREGQDSVAIFGVLDPNLRFLVGQFNSSWMNSDRRFDTTIEIADPVSTLRQQLEACDRDPGCFNARKILLAQMPQHLAEQIATKLPRFDLILSQPERDRETEEQTVRRVLTTRSLPVVLTPGIGFDAQRPNSLSANLRRADIGIHKQNEQVLQEVRNSVFDAPVPQPPMAKQEASVLAMEEQVQAASAQVGPLGSAKTYEELALQTMQQFCGSDIAMLQHRDVFARFRKAAAFWPAGRTYTTQQWLDEVLWKGDFAFCLPMKGSTLRKVLAQSDLFDTQDGNDLSVDVERGRGLSVLGVQKDPASQVPTIRGEVLDDNKLYGVALTDYLAFGDTGYPDIAAEAVQPTVRVTNLKSLNRLTGLICKRLAKNGNANGCSEEEIKADDFFTAIQQTPADSTPGLTALRELRVWASHPVQPTAGTTLVSQRPTDASSEVQSRGLWFFTLQNVDVEYSLSFLRGSDKSIPANFSGINTFSQLATPEQQRIGIWTRMRGGYSFPRFLDFYASGEERYTSNAIRQSDAAGNGNFGPYQLTLNDNLVRAEIGLLSKPIAPKIPIRLLLSENVFTQVASPFLQLTANEPCPTPGCTPLQSLRTYDLGKNLLVMTRFGARLQNRNSWFEAGREVGVNVGVPTGYLLADPGRANPFSCALAGNLSLSECIASDALFTTESRVLPNLANQRLNGWFADFHTAAPIHRSNLQLSVDSYAEAFDRRPDDTSFNTRFYEDLTVSLKVPIWGNLLFAPQVETFFFQNKIVPTVSLVTNHYTFVTTSVKLEYGFDWHRGVGIGRALRYATPLPASQSPNAPAP